MNVSRTIGLVCLIILFLPLLLLQGQQETPKQKAEGLLKDVKDKLGFNKPAKDILESLKTLEELADELHRGRVTMDIELLLLHPDPAVRRQAAKTIGTIAFRPETPPPYLKTLTERLSIDRDPEVRVAVLLALGGTGSYAKPLVPKFLDALKDPDARIRRAAAAAVFRKTIDSEAQLIPAAILALDDTDLGTDKKNPGLNCVSSIAMNYLRFSRLAAKHAAPKLIKIVNSKKADEHYRFFALLTLAAVAPEEPLPLEMARAWLKRTGSEEDLRKAIGVLGQLGPHAKEAIPDLIALAKKNVFRDPLADQVLKLGIADVFRGIGPSAKEALPTLEMMGKTEDVILRRAALDAIEIIRGNK